MRRAGQPRHDLVKKVWRNFQVIQLVPLRIASIHLVLGIAMISLSVFGGGNLPLMYGAMTALILTSSTQCAMFSYLLFKNSPTPKCFSDMVRFCLVARPYLALAFGISPVLIFLFLSAAIVGAIHLFHSISSDSDPKDSAPVLYSIGIGLIFSLAEFLPMRIHYNLIQQVGLVQELATLISPVTTSTPVVRNRLQCTDLELSACSIQNPVNMWTLSFLDCFCYRNSPETRTTESCEVLTYITNDITLDPPPPPNYWQIIKEDQSATVRQQIIKDPGEILTCSQFLRSEAEQPPPAYATTTQLRSSEIVCADKTDFINYI